MRQSGLAALTWALCAATAPAVAPGADPPATATGAPLATTAQQGATAPLAATMQQGAAAPLAAAPQQVAIAQLAAVPQPSTATAGETFAVEGLTPQLATATDVELFTPPAPAPAMSSVQLPAAPRPPPLTRLRLRQLAAWYAATGERQGNETFGQVLGRAAAEQIGKPYDFRASRRPWERLACRFDSFDCETLVELSLALSRCVWLQQRHPTCFFAQLTQLRYRRGVIDGYGSELHYFEEWLADNAQRGHLQLLSAALGGAFVSRPFFYMSRHPQRYRPLRDAAAITAVLQAETRLAHTPLAVLAREQLGVVQQKLQDGDIVAAVGSQPGLLVRHVGIVQRNAGGRPHLLHASPLARQVILAREDLQTYLRRHPSKCGIMVARPLPPE